MRSEVLQLLRSVMLGLMKVLGEWIGIMSDKIPLLKEMLTNFLDGLQPLKETT